MYRKKLLIFLKNKIWRHSVYNWPLYDGNPWLPIIYYYLDFPRTTASGNLPQFRIEFKMENRVLMMETQKKSFLWIPKLSLDPSIRSLVTTINRTCRFIENIFTPLQLLGVVWWWRWSPYGMVRDIPQIHHRLLTLHDTKYLRTMWTRKQPTTWNSLHLTRY